MDRDLTKLISIALIGFRGAGKTSVGAALARMMGGEHIDTDDLIVQEAGCSIAEIFRREGEVGFRWREVAAVERAVRARPAVLSVGGGAVLDERNVALLQSIARIVWLHAPMDVLRARIENDPSTLESRPLLTAGGTVDELAILLNRRIPIYKQVADFMIETDGLTVDATALKILQEMKQVRPN